MCGKKRKRPAAESEDDDDDETPGTQVDNASPHSINLANLRGSISKPSTLIGPLTPSMEPIVVFVGAQKSEPARRSRPPLRRQAERKARRVRRRGAASPLAEAAGAASWRDHARLRGNAAGLSDAECVHADNSLGAGSRAGRPRAKTGPESRRQAAESRPMRRQKPRRNPAPA